MNPSGSICLPRMFFCFVMIGNGDLNWRLVSTSLLPCMFCIFSTLYHVSVYFFHLHSYLFADVYEDIFLHCPIFYIWYSFVLCHSIAIVTDISNHVVSTERKKIQINIQSKINTIICINVSPLSKQQHAPFTLHGRTMFFFEQQGSHSHFYALCIWSLTDNK